MSRLRVAGLTFAAWTIVLFARADVLFVDSGAPGPVHDGSSWATAYTDLQAALAAAISNDEIWVASGTYKPSASDRTVSFALKNGVGVYGGFDGTETLRTERDPAANVTRLSGDIGTAGIVTDNSYHVVTSSAGVTATGILDGFTIAAGRADGAAAADQRGGGIYVSGGSPKLLNVVVQGNFASNRGGGARVESGSPSFSACVFEGNSATGGSSFGISFGGGGLSAGAVGALVIDRCVFRNNTVAESTSAGAIHATNNVTVSNSLFSQNSANGLVFAQDNILLTNCTIAGNSGYGIAFLGGPNNSIANSILYADGVGEIFLGPSSGVSVSYTNVEGGWSGTGNIATNPVFRNTAGGDYRLSAGSPAVDAASNPLATGLSFDLAGNPRHFDDPSTSDTGVGTPPIVDMGAYEFDSFPSVSNPSGQSVCDGGSAGFSVTATGLPPLTFRWRRNSVNLSDGGALSGTATASLSIDPAGTGNAGSYDVVVTDGLARTVTSTAATLTVHPVPSAPAITAPKSVVVGATGVGASVPAHAGSTYAWTLSAGSITSGQGTNQIAFSAAAPGTTMTLSVVENGTGGCASPQAAARVQVDFSDAPPSYLFHDAIVSVALAGITTGCGAGRYCPNDPVTRDAMAVFILRGEHGGTYDPPPAQGDVFSDVTTGTFLAKWMEQFGNEGISSGCGAGSPPPYCPTAAVTRDGMAVFLLRGKHGASFNPPAATGSVFCDVTAGTFLAKWMEQLKTENITSGCGAGACGKPNYCPTNTVTRGEMAAFIKKTFGLP